MEISFKPHKTVLYVGYNLYLLIPVEKESFKPNLLLGFSSPLSLSQDRLSISIRLLMCCCDGRTCRNFLD